MELNKEILEALNSVPITNNNTNDEIINLSSINPLTIKEKPIVKILTKPNEPPTDIPTELPINTSIDTIDLESIFTKEFLTKLKPEDLDKPLKEILLSLLVSDKDSDINKWEKREDNYVSKFNFSSPDLLSIFLANSFNHYENIHKLATDSLTIEVSTSNESSTEIISSIFTKVSKVVVPDFKLDSTIPFPSISVSFDSPTIQILSSKDTTKEYILKIPVAKVGAWKHPVYEEVKYSLEDLETIVRNFESNELGFEPPLYFGHSRGEDGTPAQGYLWKLEIEEEVLYGYWEVNKEAYRAVEDGLYRYSSSELVLNLTSKKDGKRVGKTVVGMALTNIPFVPNLPRVQALEDVSINSDVVFMSFNEENTTEEKSIISNNIEISIEEINMKTENHSEVELALKQQVEDYANKVKELELTRQELEQANKLNELKTQIESYSQKLTEYEDTKQKLSVMAEQNKQLADQLEDYSIQVRNKEVEAKVTKLSSLALPKDFVEVYSNLIKEGKFDAQVEDLVLSSLQALSQSFSTEVTNPVGSTLSTEQLNDTSFDDPYQREIDRCKKLIEQRRFSK